MPGLPASKPAEAGSAALISTNATFTHVDDPFIEANAPLARVNAPFIHADAAFIWINAPFARVNAPFAHANAPFIHANVAFARVYDVLGPPPACPCEDVPSGAPPAHNQG